MCFSTGYLRSGRPSNSEWLLTFCLSPSLWPRLLWQVSTQPSTISHQISLISSRRKCLLCPCRRHWEILQRLQALRAKSSFKSCNFNFVSWTFFRPMDGCTSSVLLHSPLLIIFQNFWNLRQFMEELIPTILAGKKWHWQYVNYQSQQICLSMIKKKCLISVKISNIWKYYLLN